MSKSDNKLPPPDPRYPWVTAEDDAKKKAHFARMQAVWDAKIAKYDGRGERRTFVVRATKTDTYDIRIDARCEEEAREIAENNEFPLHNVNTRIIGFLKLVTVFELGEQEAAI